MLYPRHGSVDERPDGRGGRLRGASVTDVAATLVVVSRAGIPLTEQGKPDRAAILAIDPS